MLEPRGHRRPLVILHAEPFRGEAVGVALQDMAHYLLHKPELVVRGFLILQPPLPVLDVLLQLGKGFVASL